jgi:hypothetical protein
MSRHRKGQFHLVNSWIEEALVSDECDEHAVTVRPPRGPRDSYSYDRPLLSAAFAPHPRHPILSDVKELSRALEAEETEIPRVFN